MNNLGSTPKYECVALGVECLPPPHPLRKAMTFMPLVLSVAPRADIRDIGGCIGGLFFNNTLLQYPVTGSFCLRYLSFPTLTLTSPCRFLNTNLRPVSTLFHRLKPVQMGDGGLWSYSLPITFEEFVK
ncbi:Hypothetical protein NTJ_03275 [Nesidiocoris tenuis]|uniref:Uncharacterized protein n=1 Tax=Nesidiocoris tenuis TaxID=355587 RepID=A0ABN7AHW5_9HEMI|nr:Hypothetical protein NTJ_03275 [Nesidiocoris tenuis]